MEAAVFFMLALRLPAYRGAMREAAMREATQTRARTAPEYNTRSAAYNNARTAKALQPARAGEIAQANNLMGGGWITHKVVKAGKVVTPGV